jgi:ribosome-associated translation inhibitor RaiA
LPFEDVIDLSDDISIADLEKIDRAAEQAEKRLEKLQRKNRKRGGIFAESTSNITDAVDKSPVNFAGTEPLSRQDKRIEKRIQRLTKKVEDDVVANFGKDKEGFARRIFGDNIGQNIVSFGQNPASFIQNSVLGLAAFSGGAFVLQIADSVIKEINRLDRFFKVFVDRIDTRVDQLRSRQQQAEIAAGLTQQILTTQSGSVDARDAYNTFNEFNNNRSKLEEDYAIRNTSGYE